MNSSSTSSSSRSGRGVAGGGAPSVSPVLPLLLLEAMRDRDRPEEWLEDEDVTISLPRRLGLSDVVRAQINKYQEEVKQRRPQLASQVEDLIRLVIRRPDAEEIFADAGRQVARRFWSERGRGIRRITRFLPRPLALVVAQRAGRRMFVHLVGPTAFRIQRRPLSLSIADSLTARADEGGAACALYAGAFAEVLELYTGRRYRVLHPICRARKAGPRCEWTVEIAG